MAVLTVPADIEARVIPIIGVPFVAKGDSLKGWDCRGCARWCLQTICGVEVPDYLDLYEAGIMSMTGRRERARLIADGLAEWRPVEPQAGVIAWLEWLGGAGHVGFMISARRVVHADTRGGTTLLDLDEANAAYRLRGAFVPSSITEIRRSHG